MAPGNSIEPRGSLPARPERSSALEGLPAFLTKAGRERLAQQNRMRHGAALQVTSTEMTLRTGERLDDMRTGSAWADQVIDEAMAQTAIERSGANADFFRRTSQ